MVGLVLAIFLYLMATVSYNTVYGQCNGTPLNVSVGYSTVVVAPPGYPSAEYAANLTCEWLVSSLDSAKILFGIYNITLICPGDAINAYDGTDNTAPQILTNGCKMTLSGGLNIYRIADSGNAYVTSTSDNLINPGENGFFMYMIAAQDFSGLGCGSTQILTATSTTQYLSSPNFPELYPLNVICNWQINTLDSSAKVFIRIEFIEIEKEPTCQYDSLQIEEAGVEIAKLCPRDSYVMYNPEKNYTSTGNNVSVRFISDDIQRERGFLLSYIQIGAETTTPEPETTTTEPEPTTTLSNRGRCLNPPCDNRRRTIIV